MMLLLAVSCVALFPAVKHQRPEGWIPLVIFCVQVMESTCQDGITHEELCSNWLRAHVSFLFSSSSCSLLMRSSHGCFWRLILVWQQVFQTKRLRSDHLSSCMDGFLSNSAESSVTHEPTSVDCPVGHKLVNTLQESHILSKIKAYRDNASGCLLDLGSTYCVTFTHSSWGITVASALF